MRNPGFLAPIVAAFAVFAASPAARAAPVKVKTDFYNLVHETSGQALTIDGTQDGTVLRASRSVGGEPQRFYIRGWAGDRVVISARNDGWQVLASNAAWIDDPVRTWVWMTSQDEMWMLEDAGHGRVRILHNTKKLYLSLQGSKVVLTQNGDVWRIQRADSGVPRSILFKPVYIQDEHTGLFLTALGSQDGAHMKLAGFHGGKSQQFLIKDWKTKGFTIETTLKEWQMLCTSRSDYGSDRQYREAGHPIWVWAWLTGANQFWRLDPIGGNEFAIRNDHSDMNLVPSLVRSVIQSRAQSSWVIRPVSDGVPLLVQYVTRVTKKDPSSQPGYFMMKGARTWSEFNSQTKVTRTFAETGRTGTKIRLQSGTQRLILDVGQMRVFESADQKKPFRIIDTIERAESVDNGWLTTLVVAEAPGQYSELAKIGPRAWVEYTAQGSRTFDETQRDEWSVYLRIQPSQGVVEDVQMDLHTKKVTRKVAGRPDLVIPITSTFGVGSKPRKGIYTFEGSYQSVTQRGLERRLKAENATLVNRAVLDTRTGRAECAVLDAKSDLDDISGSSAVLACTAGNDKVEVTTTMLYVGCDVARIDEGVGSECQAGVGSDTVTLTAKDGNNHTLEIHAPMASECTALSTERVCANLGATLASTSYRITDKNGNGLGLGVGLGVGAGIGAKYSEGVVSADVDLKFIVGGTLSLDLDTKNPRAVVEFFSQSGYEIAGGVVETVAPGVVDFVRDDMKLGPVLDGASKARSTVRDGVLDGFECVFSGFQRC